MFGNKEIQSRVQLILQLEDARIGDNYRLKSIKKTITTGQELPEVDRKYLEEQITQLQKTIDHKMMVEWAIDFVQKLRIKKNRFTFDEIKNSLEKEIDAYKIDKKFLARTSAQQKQMIAHERKVKWTLDLISELKENTEDNKKSLKDKVEHLRQIIDNKTKFAKGKLASEKDQRDLDTCYEKLQNVLDKQNKIEWTIQIIKKLEECRVGDSKKLDKIKQLLENGTPVPDDDSKYLREEYKLLQQMLKHKRQVDRTISMISELQEMEIGNPERLAAIKKSLYEGKEIPESEITYLEQKCELLMIAKKSEKEPEPTIRESQVAKYLHNSILAELNAAIKELVKLQSKSK